jgi:hypothetical protein
MTRITKSILALSFLLSAFSLKAQQKITIQFKNKVGQDDLQLIERTYTNSFGEPFTVNRFKYYVSHILLIDSTNQFYQFPNDYFLIDAADSLSQTIILNTTAKKIKTIHFMIGVDSIKNISGVQTGNLDPLKGMFWTWNTGYVFAKLEGQSDSSHAPAHYFSYHIGGFRQNENAEKIIMLNTQESNNNIIKIKVDVLKWFDGVHNFPINKNAACHQPGFLAMQIADNYAKMFSIQR